MTLNRVYGVHFVGTSACDEWFPREKYVSAWSGPGWRAKMESSPGLGPGTKLSLLGHLLTCIGLHTKLWFRNLGMVWEDVRQPILPGL